MRIISGQFKGKKIHEPTDSKTRPLKDLVKESIFNIIIHSKKFDIEISKAIVLDLFSGVGSFGIECLSRGAKNVVFVENYEKVLPILKKNLNNLKYINNFEILNFDIKKGINFHNITRKFDIIFLDPPFKNEDLNYLLQDIYNKKIIKKESLVIIHRHKNANDLIPKTFKIIEQKKYGLSKIIFLSLD